MNAVICDDRELGYSGNLVPALPSLSFWLPTPCLEKTQKISKCVSSSCWGFLSETNKDAIGHLIDLVSRAKRELTGQRTSERQTSTDNYILEYVVFSIDHSQMVVFRPVVCCQIGMAKNVLTSSPLPRTAGRTDRLWAQPPADTRRRWRCESRSGSLRIF